MRSVTTLSRLDNARETLFLGRDGCQGLSQIGNLVIPAHAGIERLKPQVAHHAHCLLLIDISVPCAYDLAVFCSLNIAVRDSQSQIAVSFEVACPQALLATPASERTVGNDRLRAQLFDLSATGCARNFKGRETLGASVGEHSCVPARSTAFRRSG